jgi:hypothetical protein
MTAQREPLSKYLETCTDREYAEYIIATMAGSCPNEWDAAKAEAIDAIRSRPHPLAPEQKPGCYITCPFDDLCANDIEKVQAIEAEAARAATLAERERLLKAAHEINAKRFCPSMVDTQYHCCDVMACLDEILESLRQQAGEQG